MPNVVNPFDRSLQAQPKQSTPRHRREGDFDESDVWHDAADSPLAANG